MTTGGSRQTGVGGGAREDWHLAGRGLAGMQGHHWTSLDITSLLQWRKTEEGAGVYIS